MVDGQAAQVGEVREIGWGAVGWCLEVGLVIVAVNEVKASIQSPVTLRCRTCLTSANSFLFSLFYRCPVRFDRQESSYHSLRSRKARRPETSVMLSWAMVPARAKREGTCIDQMAIPKLKRRKRRASLASSRWPDEKGLLCLRICRCECCAVPRT